MGIIVGTLGVGELIYTECRMIVGLRYISHLGDYLSVVERLKTVIKKAGKKVDIH